MQTINDVLQRNHPQFNVVSPETSVKDALYKMYCEQLDYVIVEKDKQFIGILTEHDVAGRVLFSEKPLHNTFVKEFMTTVLPVITGHETLEYGMRLLENYKAKYLAVYENFNFKTIVSAQELMRGALDQQPTPQNV